MLYQLSYVGICSVFLAFEPECARFALHWHCNSLRCILEGISSPTPRAAIPQAAIAGGRNHRIDHDHRPSDTTGETRRVVDLAQRRPGRQRLNRPSRAVPVK